MAVTLEIEFERFADAQEPDATGHATAGAVIDLTAEDMIRECART